LTRLLDEQAVHSIANETAKPKTSAMVRVGICGAAGRMGKMVIEVCHGADDVELSAAVEYDNSPMIGMDAGEAAGLGKQNVEIVNNIGKVIDQFDVLIDFTLAASISNTIEQCRAAGKKMVIGTTGLSESQTQLINDASADIAMVFAPNMSIGVNLCFKLLETAARIVGEDADIEIIEAHHRAKKDAPSGTALTMGEIIANTLGRQLQECAIYGRQGHTDGRDKNTIGFETIRAGNIVGEHTVMFATADERVEIVHKATSRKTFAGGAVKAAKWLHDKPSGLYDMLDVLGLK